jgi:hypothetical protein
MECNSENERTFENMEIMPIINEAEILHNLKKRAQLETYFTYSSGNLLIVLDSGKDISSLFNEKCKN